MTELPTEVWYIVCEYLPIYSLSNFTLPNIILYNCVKRRCPKLKYKNRINYTINIMEQIINLKNNFIILSFIDNYEFSIGRSLNEWCRSYFTVIKNNISGKKTLFTIPQVICCLLHTNWGENCCCLFETILINDEPILHHMGKFGISYNSSDTIYSYKNHLHSNSLQLKIVKNHLTFTCDDKKHYNKNQYNQNNCLKNNCVNAVSRSYLIHNCVNGIPMYLPNIYHCSGSITEYNFILEDSIVEQIYKNIFITVNNRIMSYFVKKGIKFYVISNEEEYSYDIAECLACKIHSKCKTACNACGSICSNCNGRSKYSCHSADESEPRYFDDQCRSTACGYCAKYNSQGNCSVKKNICSRNVSQYN